MVKACLLTGVGDGGLPNPPPGMMSNNLVNPSLGIMEEQWREEQANDESIGPILELVKKCQLFKYKCKPEDPMGMKILLKFKNSLLLRKGLLYRKVQLKQHEEPTLQFVLLSSFHKQMGHMGMDRTLVMLQSRFFWPKMSSDVRIHIRSCKRCIRFKQPQEREVLNPIKTTYPLELVHLEYLTIGHGNKTINILVITDHFNHYAQAFVTPKQTVVVMAKTFGGIF